MFKKALIYLGLGPDEEYEQYDDFAPSGGAATEEGRPVVRAVEPPPRQASSAVRPLPATRSPARVSTVRVVPADPTLEEDEPAPTLVSPSPTPAESADGASAIRIVDTAPTKPYAVTPTSFNEAQAIGDRFKSGQPVIVNLQGIERDLRRRLVDFASGLCYALGGKMDRVADQVYLLIPADVEVSSDDTRRALD
ncbi:MAG: cell division protein SepF [Acidimicrobiales bacterium]|jgi:cell division inhibitor SepF|nr:cell division protein SepF [Acidimicrobiales bacterium]